MKADEKLGFAPGRLDRITSHIEERYIAPGKIAGCQMLVARGGEIAYRRCFGLADRERGKPMAENTIFRLYSMAKPITSVALMMLHERGMFQLDDPVASVAPAWKDVRVWVSGAGAAMETQAPKRPPTFRDLLRHTAGLGYGAALAAFGAADVHPVDAAYAAAGIERLHDVPLAAFVERFGQAPLYYQPGARWQYSYATDVCGGLVEILAAKRFAQFLQDEIFGPLGMADTAFHVPPEKQARFAACYARDEAKNLVLRDDPETSDYLDENRFPSGGGGLVSTMDDYFRFCEMLRCGGALEDARILGPRTVELMHMNHLPGGGDLSSLATGQFSETAYDGVGFGLGFASTLEESCLLGPGDFYWGGAASTIFWVDPIEDLSVIFLTQLTPSRTFNFRGQFKALIYSALAD